MTKKLKILLISVLFLVATVCVCLFAGCKVKYTVDELKEKYGLTAQITYFLNSDGGDFGKDTYVKNLYYKTGALPMDVGHTAMLSGSSKMNVKKGYKFLDWCIVETDSSGAPLCAADENGEKKVYSDGDEYDVKRGMSSTGEKFDFTKPLEEGEHIYLCGDFEPDVKVELHLLCEEYGDDKFDQLTYVSNGNEVTVKDREIIEDGCTNITKDGIGLASYSIGLQDILTDYTVVDFYEYDESTEQFTAVSAINYPEPDDEGKYNDVKIYVKVLKGNWKILSSYSDVNRMFGLGYEKYYLNQDIDCKEQSDKGQSVNIAVTTLLDVRSFSGTIYGGKKGHTIKNLVLKGASELGQANKASMFGTIESSAAFENVTFENVTLDFTVASRGQTTIDANVKFVADEIQNGATFKNFNISGSLNIKLSSVNSAVTSTTQEDWLFGGKDDATFKEITVTQATCTIIGHDDVIVDTFTFNNKNQTEDLS